MSDISNKILAARGGGHIISPVLEEILKAMDARLEALEPKKEKKESWGESGKPLSSAPKVTGQMMLGSKPASGLMLTTLPNPLDGVHLKD